MVKSDFLREYMGDFIQTHAEAIAETMGKNEKGKDIFLRLWYSAVGDFFVVEFMIGQMKADNNDYAMNYYLCESVESVDDFLTSLTKNKKAHGEIDYLVSRLIREASKVLK
jgi:hypothetical protein